MEKPNARVLVMPLSKTLTRLKGEFSFVHGNLLILMISWILINFTQSIPGTYYAEYVRRLGGSAFIVGVIGSASLVANALVMFPGGYLADKYGRRWLILWASLGIALTYVFYAFAPIWHFILIGAILQNLCLIYQPALTAMTADSIPPKKRGIGFSTIGLITGVLAIPSPIIAGLLFAHYGLVSGMRLGYLIVVAGWVVSFTVRLKLRETLIGGGEKVDLKAVMRMYPRAIKEGIGVWKIVPRSMLHLFAIYAAGNFFSASFGLYVLLYALDVLHVKEFEWALVWMWLLATTLGLALPCGKLVDRIGRKKPLVVSWLLEAASMYFLIYGGLAKLFVATALHGVATALRNAALPALQADLVPRELRGKVAGSTNFANLLLGSAGLLIGGFFYDYVSPQLPFLLFMLISVPCGILTLIYVHEPKKREK